MPGNVEHRVQEIGRHILQRARHGHGWSSLRRRQEEHLLGQLMENEALRVQMLRFVDVLPSLQSDAQLVEHAREYLGSHDLLTGLPRRWSRLAGLAHWGIEHARQGVAAHVLAAAIRSSVNAMAKRFIAGDQADTTLRVLERLHRRGLGFTLDLLGEATVSEDECEQYQARYLALLDQLAPQIDTWAGNEVLDRIGPRRCPRLNLSLKVSALYSQMDPVDTVGSADTVKARLRPILQRARQLGAFITIDMEQYDFKNITLKVFKETLTEPEFADWPDVGIAMQAYLRDTPDDLRQLVAWARKRSCPVTVRLVRGAYWDYETVLAQQNSWPVPVWTHKNQTDSCYEACTQLLLDSHPAVEAAIGTHNVRSLAHAIAYARSLRLDPHQYELQMLFGMADPLKQVLVEMKQRLRVYVPFGQLIPGMAYLVRRLLENTGSQSFLRMTFTEDLSADKLLAAPELPARPEPVQQPRASQPPERALAAAFAREPMLRLADATEREAFASAIEKVRAKLGHYYPLVIGAEHRRTVESIVSHNPADNSQIVGITALAGEQDVEHAIEAASAAAHGDWAAMPWSQRARILLEAANLMRQERDELSAWEIFEAGKTWREADADVTEAIDFFEYYARQGMVLGRGHDLHVPGQTNHYVYQPRGVAAVIAPWNFPLAIVAGMTAAALVTGNTVLLKPAPQTPVIAAHYVDLLHRAGLPAGVINFLPGDDDTGKALVRSPHVHLIAFTGSQAAGCAIYETASKVQPGQDHLKRVIAEMGGKNAIIVDESADLDEAVRSIVASAFSHQGQKCSAASRIIVVGRHYELLLQRLASATTSLNIGLPEHPGTALGPVIDREAQQRIVDAITRGRQIARLVLQIDTSHLTGGHFVGPAIFADVPPDSFLAQEEIFGPVLAIMRARTFEEAVALANQTRFALTGGVYSRTPSHLRYARRHFNVGNLYLNQKITGAIVGRQPFGGSRMSGVGSKAGGPDYLLQFVEPRTITENTLRRGFAPDEAIAEQVEEL